MCGFANAKGGSIWIGIDDDKSVVGVTGAKKLMEDIPNKIKDTMGIVVDVALLKKQRKDVLRIDVPESDFPVAYHGEYQADTGITYDELAERLHCSRSTIRRRLEELKTQKRIAYIGSDKSGHWEVL